MADPDTWLHAKKFVAAGAVTVGLGAALAAGSGVAGADDPLNADSSAATAQLEPDGSEAASDNDAESALPTDTDNAQTTTTGEPATSTEQSTTPATPTEQITTDVPDDAVPSTTVAPPQATSPDNTEGSGVTTTEAPTAPPNSRSADNDDEETESESQTFTTEQSSEASNIDTDAIPMTAKTSSATATSVHTAPKSAGTSLLVGFLAVFGLSPQAAGTSTTIATTNPIQDLAFAFFRRIQTNLDNGTPTVTAGEPTQDSDGLIGGTLQISDPDDDPLTVEVIGAPTNGSVSVNPDGIYVFTPNADLASQGGIDSFVVRVTETNADSHAHGFSGLANRIINTLTSGRAGLNDGSSATVTVPVTVVPTNHAPTIGTPPYTQTTDTATGVVTGQIVASDDDGDTLTYRLGNPVDSTIAVITIDPVTGAYVVSPTLRSRYLAFASGSTDTAVAFTVSVTDGSSTKYVDVNAPITPRDPALDGALGVEELRALIASGEVFVSENSDGTVRVLDGRFMDTAVHSEADAAIVFNRVADLLGAPSGFITTGNVSSQSISIPLSGGALNETYYRGTPTVNGVPVIGSDVVLVTDTATGEVKGLFSTYDTATRGISTTPTLSADDAEAIAARVMTAGYVDPANSATTAAFTAGLITESTLVVDATDKDAGPVPAWLVTVTGPEVYSSAEDTEIGRDPEKLVVSYLITAAGPNTGTIVGQSDSIDAADVAYVQESDLNGVTHNLFLLEADGSSLYGYWYADPARSIYVHTADQQAVFGIPTGGTELTNMHLIGGSSNADANPNAVSALTNVATAYDFYRTVLGYVPREGGKVGGVDTTKYIDVYLVDDYPLGTNAKYEAGHPRIVLTGGDEIALDAVGHEYTHTVMKVIRKDKDPTRSQSTEKNSLDEAYADIMGVLIDADANGQTKVTDFLLGEDETSCTWRTTEYGCAFRNLADPKSLNGTRSVYDFRTNYDERDTSNTTSAKYNNSTIFSHAAAAAMEDPRTADVTVDEWAQVYYASMPKLSSTSTFRDAQAAVVSSAKSQGFTPTEIEALQDAFDCAGISANSCSPGPSEPVLTTHYTVLDRPGAPVTVVNDDGTETNYYPDADGIVRIPSTVHTALARPYRDHEGQYRYAFDFIEPDGTVHSQDPMPDWEPALAGPQQYITDDCSADCEAGGPVIVTWQVLQGNSSYTETFYPGPDGIVHVPVVVANVPTEILFVPNGTRYDPQYPPYDPNGIFGPQMIDGHPVNPGPPPVAYFYPDGRLVTYRPDANGVVHLPDIDHPGIEITLTPSTTTPNTYDISRGPDFVPENGTTYGTSVSYEEIRWGNLDQEHLYQHYQEHHQGL
ncbi:UNVERIFIED_CONTAM: Zn-dependent metalloprotease [Williamsia faeni]